MCFISLYFVFYINNRYLFSNTEENTLIRVLILYFFILTLNRVIQKGSNENEKEKECWHGWPEPGKSNKWCKKPSLPPHSHHKPVNLRRTISFRMEGGPSISSLSTSKVLQPGLVQVEGLLNLEKSAFLKKHVSMMPSKSGINFQVTWLTVRL